MPTGSEISYFFWQALYALMIGYIFVLFVIPAIERLWRAWRKKR
jgi:hypothetical protein